MIRVNSHSFNALGLTWVDLPQPLVRRFGGLTGSPGTSQKEGQEDQAEIQELGVDPIIVSRSLSLPGLPSGALGSLSIYQTALTTSLPFLNLIQVMSGPDSPTGLL